MDLSVALILLFTFYELLEATNHPTKPIDVKKPLRKVALYI